MGFSKSILILFFESMKIFRSSFLFAICVSSLFVEANGITHPEFDSLYQQVKSKYSTELGDSLIRMAKMLGEDPLLAKSYYLVGYFE